MLKSWTFLCCHGRILSRKAAEHTKSRFYREWMKKDENAGEERVKNCECKNWKLNENQRNTAVTVMGFGLEPVWSFVRVKGRLFGHFAWRLLRRPLSVSCQPSVLMNDWFSLVFVSTTVIFGEGWFFKRSWVGLLDLSEGRWKEWADWAAASGLRLVPDVIWWLASSRQCVCLFVCLLDDSGFNVPAVSSSSLSGLPCLLIIL